jgi:MinD superfamily P-loop ATPase
MVSKTGNSFTIAVASGKGGTGKTFVSTNIFYALAAQGKVTLVDCDAEAPNAAAFFDLKATDVTTVSLPVPVIDTNACTFCGLCHEYCNYGAIFYLPDAGIIQVLDDLCHSCGACTVACKFQAITEKEVEAGKVTEYDYAGSHKILEARMRIGAMTPVPVIKKAISMAENRQDILILDAPPGTSCPFVHTVTAADYVILVTEPTPFGLSDLRQSVETLRLMDKPFGVIINRAGLGNDEVKNYLHDENIDLLLQIPFDREIAIRYSNAQLMAQHQPQLADALVNMVNKIKYGHGNSHYKR